VAATIGIRREDKNIWERRVPLTPADIAELKRGHELEFVVQKSPNRVFPDVEYTAAGVALSDEIPDTDVVLAVKEIPTALLRARKTYVYFAHVIKGQPYNMPMLRRLLDLEATLIDYEKIVDDHGRRLIFFSIHAGYAGMIETLWCAAHRLAAQGRHTPLLEIKHAYEYANLAAAQNHLREIGVAIAHHGLGGMERPLAIGIAGYGNVARGCHEILACLPATEVLPGDLFEALRRPVADSPILVVTYREEDLAAPRTAGTDFELQDYYDHPERYEGIFELQLPLLDVLVNGTYWDARYPRLVTCAWVSENYGPGRQPRLKVIGDISCDIAGGIEVTVKATMPDDPCYVWQPDGSPRFGVTGDGPVIMAVDNLPCELPRESSEYFSRVLHGMIPSLAACDWSRDFADLELPRPLKSAVIAHRGRLAPNFEYLQAYLNG
jgi:alanine dehydrogenase